MQVEESIKIMKALADKSRLFILNALIEKPQYVEEISKRLELAASTVSFHLKKLEAAGLVKKEKEQYYIIYKINEQIFSTKLQNIISFENLEATVQNNRIDSYKEKVISTFFKNGRLVQIPKQHKKRWIILEKFIQLFEANKNYSEKEVDNKISDLFDDYCTIRRYLVDEKILIRDKGNYCLKVNSENKGSLFKSYKASIENN